MSNIYSFLNNVWKELIEENKANYTFIPLLFLLVTFPISMAINNLGTLLFFISGLYYFKKRNFNFKIEFVFPIVLFLWIASSYFWSYDKVTTLKFIPREITLFLIPLLYLFIPKYTEKQKDLIYKYFSFSMFFYAIFFIIRACIRFFIIKDTSVFFYHGPNNFTDIGLVPRLLNAIHVSVYMVLAFFYFFIKENKTLATKSILITLFLFIVLLSSKNIIVVFVLLIGIYLFYFSKIANKFRLRNLILVIIALSCLLSFDKIKERFLIEFTSNSEKSLSHNVEVNHIEGVNNISIYEAWYSEKFTHNDYFPGTAFRVYQIRIFTELLNEYPIFWKGFGLEASQQKIKDKEKEHNLYPGYGSYNFHNQYIQMLAELGIIGLILLIIILFINLKNAIKSSSFIYIAFAVVMISLFLTESFLWRQRGVFFFIIFYCLFLHNNYKDKSL